jgi:epoxyqueuosine reductase
VEFRPLPGKRIDGCDDCRPVCPWKRCAGHSHAWDFAPRHGLEAVRLVQLFGWNEDEFPKKTEA